MEDSSSMVLKVPAKVLNVPISDGIIKYKCSESLSRSFDTVSTVATRTVHATKTRFTT